MSKRTYQPHKTRRARTHGFLVRSRTKNGRAVIRRRGPEVRSRSFVSMRPASRAKIHPSSNVQGRTHVPGSGRVPSVQKTSPSAGTGWMQFPL